MSSEILIPFLLVQTLIMSQPLYSRIASRYYFSSSRRKEGGIFEAPPLLFKEVSSFFVKKYAGHILAKTEERINTLLQSKEEHDWERLEDEGKQAFDDLFLWLNERDQHEDGQEKVFPIRPDLNKGLWVKVEMVVDRPHYTYAYTKGRRPQGREYGLYPGYKIWNKMQKVHRKQMTELIQEARKGKQMGSDSDLVELNLLKKACLQYTNKAKAYKTTSRTSIEVDLTGWEPLERKFDLSVGQIEKIIEKMKNEKTKTLKEIGSSTSSLSFDLIEYVGTGLKFQKVTETYEVTSSSNNEEDEDSVWLLRSPLDEEPDRFDNEKDLIKTVTSLYDQAIEYNQEALESITWSNLYDQLEGKNISDIKVILDFVGHQKRGGIWNYKERELQVDMPKDALTVKDFKKNIKDIIRVTRHECQHVGQTVFDVLTNTAMRPGTPGASIQVPRSRELGRNQRYHRKPHALREVEFYTRLGDEVDRFIRWASNIPQKWRRSALRVWISNPSPEDQELVKNKINPFLEKNRSTRIVNEGDQLKSVEFFRMLKNNEPEKWKKAVKEMVQEVQKQVSL